MSSRRAIVLTLLPLWATVGACAGGAANHRDTKATGADEVTVASATTSSRSPSPISSSSPRSSASSRPSAPKSPPVVTGSMLCDEYIARLRACAREIEPEVMAGLRPVTESHIASLTLQINAARDPHSGPPEAQQQHLASIEAGCTSMLAGLPPVCGR